MLFLYGCFQYSVPALRLHSYIRKEIWLSEINFAILQIKTRIDMAKFKGTINVDKDRCKGCGICVANCPVSVMKLAPEVNEKGYNYAMLATPDGCIGCASCGIVCPDGVITVYKEKVTG